MDSMKTSLLQQQECPERNTQKPYILTLIFMLTLIVTGILTITTVIVIRQSSRPDSTYTYVEPTVYKCIQAICAFAPCKDLCNSTLLSSISTNTSELDSFLQPENIIFLSFQVGVTQLNQLASLHNISKPNDIPESALLECQVLLNKELSGLNYSVSSFKNLYYFSKIEVGEYVSVFRRMESYQQACLDRLEESSAGSAVINEFRSNVQETRRYMINTRAILLNIDSILDNIFGYTSSGAYDYDSYYFDGLSYEYMIIFVPVYVFLILLFILMLKP